MSRIIKIKNASGAGGTWVGQTIPNGTYITIQESEITKWISDDQVFTDVGSGNLIVNSGADTTDDITNPTCGWKWLLGDTLPYSRHLEGKLAVHASAKPEPTGVETYAVWTGSGDDLSEPDETLSIGNGELLAFNMTYGTPVVTKDIKFDARHGRVWAHEAYVKFENGGVDDYLTADIMAPATPLQQAVDLNYIVEDNWVKYATGSPAGTHGFAGTPVLIPRSFSKDGDWDYDGTNLTPNFTGTGEYKISSIDRVVHRYFSKIPLYGTSATYFTMSSEETAEIPVSSGYFIRVNVYNNSNSNWNISIIMEIYRERTVCP
jgi:hypothetical protein